MNLVTAEPSTIDPDNLAGTPPVAVRLDSLPVEVAQFQRQPDPDRVRYMVEHYDPDLMRPIVVMTIAEDDSVVVPDGKHRELVARAVGKEWIMAVVLAGQTISDAAQLFVGLNGATAPITAPQAHGAALMMNEPTACAIEQVLRAHGLTAVSKAATAFTDVPDGMVVVPQVGSWRQSIHLTPTYPKPNRDAVPHPAGPAAIAWTAKVLRSWMDLDRRTPTAAEVKLRGSHSALIYGFSAFHAVLTAAGMPVPSPELVGQKLRYSESRWIASNLAAACGGHTKGLPQNAVGMATVLAGIDDTLVDARRVRRLLGTGDKSNGFTLVGTATVQEAA